MAGTEIDLDLSTLVERKNVRIVSKLHPDGKLYELRTVDDLGVIEHQRFQQAAGDARKLQGVSPEKMTGKQAQLLKKSLDTAVSIVLPDLEDKVMRDLSDHKLGQIVELFIAQFPPGQLEDGEGGGSPPPTGDG